MDNSRVVRLQRTTHPLVRTATDLGRASADLPMDRMLLQLKGSPEQDAALHQLLEDQQDSGSPRYQAWLTPEQFGEQFGPAQQDIDAITTWLQSQGFRVNEVARGRGSIEFSGTAQQVEQAFRTQIHHFEVNGERHVANATDIAIPDALTEVVAGVHSLHDFRIKPMHHRIQPDLNLSGGSHAIAPYDFAAIYNVATLWNASFDGAGQTIAISGRTNIKASDIASFRSQFGLPANNTQIIVNGADPGIVSSGEETEADLDVEWSGAVAKGATIKFVTSKSTNAADGVDLSNQYIVNNNIASVMSLSFGACEAALGGGNAFYNSLWQQAAAQGISVFVSSGDAGSAGCDAPSSTPATHGLGVNGLASTPYNVAVGGTEFSDANAAAYWNTSNDAHVASAKGYIPEVVWNESAYTTAGASANNLYAGSGGVSTVYPTPAWQTGNGVPGADPGTTSSHHRYMPDISLTAAGHDGYIVVQEGGLMLVGGTSASSPSFAGIMAIINQYTGARNGNPNTRLYPLAAQFPAVFHDVTGGTNAVPCAGGTPNCSATAPSTNIGRTNGYAAAAGYDMATGLGSVDAYALAVNWGAHIGNPPAAIASLSPNPMQALSTNQNLTITGTGFVTGAGLKVLLGSTAYTGAQIASSTPTQIQVSVNVGTTTRTVAVQVVNPNGLASNTASLQVNAPAAPPAIASLTPNPMTGSSSFQTLIVNGAGFQAGLKVQVGKNALPSSQVVVVSGTQVQASVNVGTAAQTLTVQVTNPNGVASNTANLQVTAPATLAIASLSPNPLTHSGATQTLTIAGTGFKPGDTVWVWFGGWAALPASQVLSVSATQIQVRITVSAAGTHYVALVDPNTTVSNYAPLQVN